MLGQTRESLGLVKPSVPNVVSLSHQMDEETEDSKVTDWWQVAQIVRGQMENRITSPDG